MKIKRTTVKSWLFIGLLFFALSMEQAFCSPTITRLTENSYPDTQPVLNGNEIIFLRNYNMALYNNGTTTDLTSDFPTNQYSNMLKSGDYLAYRQYHEGQFTTYYSDGTNTTELIPNGDTEKLVDLKGNTLYLWNYQTNAFRKYDGTNFTSLPNTSYPNEKYGRPSIDMNGDKIVWGNGTLYVYDGTNTTELTALGICQRPAINANRIAYVNPFAEASNIMLYDIATDTISLISTTAPYIVEDVMLYGDIIVWLEKAGTSRYTIKSYDISDGTETLIAENAYLNGYDLDIDKFVFSQNVTGSSSELFLVDFGDAQPSVPEPASIILFIMALGSMARKIFF